jgi:hypothetical protein
MRGYQLVLCVDASFCNTTKGFENITLHIKLKPPLHHAGLQTSLDDPYTHTIIATCRIF